LSSLRPLDYSKTWLCSRVDQPGPPRLPPPARPVILRGRLDRGPCCRFPAMLRQVTPLLASAVGLAVFVGVLGFLDRKRQAPPPAPVKSAAPVAVQPPPRIEPPEARIRRKETWLRRPPYPAEKLEELVVGNTREEVLKLLGEPDRTERGRDGDSNRWAYTRLTSNSELTVLQFHRDGERVTVESVVYQLATRP
jgi:hypothetical protein